MSKAKDIINTMELELKKDNINIPLMIEFVGTLKSMKEVHLITADELIDDYYRKAKLAVDYYNLDLSNESALDSFLIRHNSLISFWGKYAGNLLEKSKEFLRDDHPMYHRIVDKILKNKVLSDEEINHIQNRINSTLTQRKVDDNWILESFVDVNTFPFRFIYEWLINLSKERGIIGYCQLEGCANIFIIRPSGKTQKYCSNTHRVKAFREIKKELLTV